MDHIKQCIRTYDIRGTFKSLTPKACWSLAYAFGKRCMGERVVVAYDGRDSSPLLHRWVLEGLRAADVEAISLGLGSTPFLYWSYYHLEALGGIMITGSHNPKDENGMKFMWNRGPFFGQALQDMYEVAREVSSTYVPKQNIQFQKKEVHEPYLQSLARSWTMLPTWENAAKTSYTNLSIVWNTVHGMVGHYVAQAVKHLPGQHHIFHREPRGDFGGQSPNPEDNFDQTRAYMDMHNADFGFVFDGDGDRFVCLTSQGHCISGDEMTLFLSQYLTQKGDTLAFDIKASPLIMKCAQDVHERSVITLPTGHVYMKQALGQKKAVMGGEISGHFFFQTYVRGIDDGLYTAGVFLLCCQDWSAFYASLPDRYTSGEKRWFVPGGQKSLQRIQDTWPKDVPYDTIDGLRAFFPEGSMVLRASQTQEQLCVCLESEKPDQYAALVQRFSRMIQAVGIPPSPLCG